MWACSVSYHTYTPMLRMLVYSTHFYVLSLHLVLWNITLRASPNQNLKSQILKGTNMAWILQGIHFHKRTAHRKHVIIKNASIKNKLPVHVLALIPLLYLISTTIDQILPLHPLLILMIPPTISYFNQHFYCYLLYVESVQVVHQMSRRLLLVPS